MTKKIFCVLLLLSLLILSGCDNNVHLKGKVIFSDDGSPVPVGQICFEKEGSLARGDLKPDGTFVVSFLKLNDGLPPGKYSVYISGAMRLIGKDPRTGGDIYESLVDEKFCRGSTSGIEIEVTPTMKKDVEIVVDRYKPVPKKTPASRKL